MKYLPQVVCAKYDEDFVIRTVFDDGTEKTYTFQSGSRGQSLNPSRIKGTLKSFSSKLAH
jgi:hypothetical protein